MNVYDINVDENILQYLIDKALIDTVRWITYQCGGKPQKLDYVAALTLKFTRNFFDIFNFVFSRYRFSVSGAYCHQKPIVVLMEIKNRK